MSRATPNFRPPRSIWCTIELRGACLLLGCVSSFSRFVSYQKLSSPKMHMAKPEPHRRKSVQPAPDGDAVCVASCRKTSHHQTFPQNSAPSTKTPRGTRLLLWSQPKQNRVFTQVTHAGRVPVARVNPKLAHCPLTITRRDMCAHMTTLYSRSTLRRNNAISAKSTP